MFLLPTNRNNVVQLQHGERAVKKRKKATAFAADTLNRDPANQIDNLVVLFEPPVLGDNNRGDIERFVQDRCFIPDEQEIQIPGNNGRLNPDKFSRTDYYET